MPFAKRQSGERPTKQGSEHEDICRNAIRVGVRCGGAFDARIGVTVRGAKH
jgi:hypothetical protein